MAALTSITTHHVKDGFVQVTVTREVAYSDGSQRVETVTAWWKPGGGVQIQTGPERARLSLEALRSLTYMLEELDAQAENKGA